MFRWMNSRENAKYRICFRPFYGAATGIVLCLLNLLCQRFDLGQSCFALIGAAVPVLMSGGSLFSAVCGRPFDDSERQSDCASRHRLYDIESIVRHGICMVSGGRCGKGRIFELFSAHKAGAQNHS